MPQYTRGGRAVARKAKRHSAGNVCPAFQWLICHGEERWGNREIWHFGRELWTGRPAISPDVNDRAGRETIRRIFRSISTSSARILRREPRRYENHCPNEMNERPIFRDVTTL